MKAKAYPAASKLRSPAPATMHPRTTMKTEKRMRGWGSFFDMHTFALSTSIGVSLLTVEYVGTLTLSSPLRAKAIFIWYNKVSGKTFIILFLQVVTFTIPKARSPCTIAIPAKDCKISMKLEFPNSMSVALFTKFIAMATTPYSKADARPATEEEEPPETDSEDDI